MVSRMHAASLGALIALSGSAHAESTEPNRVANAWKQAGAFGESIAPQFIFDNQTVTLKLPSAPRVAQCMHIAVIGDRGIGFRAKLENATDDPLVDDDGKRAGSSAGAAELVACGEFPKRAYIQSHSGRGALDVVVAFGPRDLPPIQSILPDRAPGPHVSMRDVPGGGDQTPLAQRISDFDVRAQNDGYPAPIKSTVTLGDDGTAELNDFVGAGCHLIRVFAPDALRSARRVDLDAELRDAEEGRVLVRDRSEAPDAKIEACLATGQGVSLFVGGAAPGTRVTIARATTQIPAGAPSNWGDAARSAFATAMRTHHLKEPSGKPVFLSLGASGGTTLPIEVEPGACYVAIATRLRGGLRALSLRARVGLAESTDARGSTDAALVSFCTGARSRVEVDVDARGASLSWGLALFRTTSAQWGAL